MKNPKIYLLLIPLLFLISCEEEVFFEEDPSSHKLVVSSLFAADSSFTVFVGHTQSMADTISNIFIDNASVTLSDDQGNTEILTLTGKGKYESSNIIARTGTEYTLQVSAAGYQSIQASDIIPEPEQIVSAETFEGIGISNTYGEVDDLAIIKFTNNPNFEQYFDLFFYQISDTVIHSDFNFDTGIETSDTFFNVKNWCTYYNCDNPLIKAENYDYYSTTSLLFSDRNSADNNIELRVSYGFHLHFILTVCTVSKNYYNYIKSLRHHRYYLLYARSYNLLSVIFISLSDYPPEIHSNIENGYGIFAGYSFDMREIESYSQQ